MLPAEDMELIRGALVALLGLESDLAVVAEAASGDAAVGLALAHRTVSDPNVLMELTALNSPRPAALPVVATTGPLFSIAVTGAAVVTWVRGWRGWTGRLSYTLLVVAAVAFYEEVLPRSHWTVSLFV